MADDAGDRLLTVAEAAEACGVSDDTIRRRLADGDIPGAFRRGDGPRAPWRIPASGLRTAGLHPAVDAPAPAADSGLDEKVRSLRAQLAAKDETIRALRAVLAAKDETIAALRRLAARQDG